MARADILGYPRITRGFQGVNLRSRGYLNGICLRMVLAPCLALSNPQRIRAEATAQALAIHRLSLARNDFASYNDVDWEVAPSPDSLFAPNSDDATADTEEAITPGCGDPWRIDIAVDRQAIFEVKAWKKGAGVAEAVTQLQCYQSKAAAIGVAFVRSTELALSNWVMPWVDQHFGVWCTWADSANAGVLLFSRRADPTIPPSVRSACLPEINLPEVSPEWIRASTHAFELLAALAGANWVWQKAAPVLRQAYQWTVKCLAKYQVAVVMHPTQLTTLKIEYGDGASESFAIPAGNGIHVVSASHFFAPNRLGNFVQRATIVQTSAEAVGVTYHISPTEEYCGPSTCSFSINGLATDGGSLIVVQSGSVCAGDPCLDTGDRFLFMHATPSADDRSQAQLTQRTCTMGEGDLIVGDIQLSSNGAISGTGVVPQNLVPGNYVICAGIFPLVLYDTILVVG